VVRQEGMTTDQTVQLAHHIRDRTLSIGCTITAYKTGALPVLPDNATGRPTRMEAISNCRTF
jgi:hypothetical protein